MVGETSGHSGRARQIAARGLLTSSQLWPLEFETQGQVRLAEMIIGAPPVEMGEQFTRELSGGPAATGQSRQSMSQGEDLP